MNQAICPAQVNESTKIAQADNLPATNVTFAKLGQQLCFLFPSPFAHGSPFGENQAITLTIQLDYLELEFLAHQRGPHIFSAQGLILASPPSRG